MLSPSKVKHRKQHKGRLRGTAYRGAELSFGTVALKALECGKLSSQQIEAARIAINRKISRGGKMWIRIFPDKPITKKPAETRMGNGKGNPEFWVAQIKPGRILYELGGVDEDLAVEALRLASYKLPFKTKIITERESI